VSPEHDDIMTIGVKRACEDSADLSCSARDDDLHDCWKLKAGS
jgi:hypothetical protein